MFSAVLSPASYSTHFLSASLYLLVLLLAMGYAAVLTAADAMNRYTSAEGRHSGALATIVRHRWYWIPALYALAMFLVLMLTLE